MKKNELKLKININLDSISNNIKNAVKFLKKFCIKQDIIDDICICLSESLTNIIDHSGISNNDKIDLSLSIRQKEIIIIIKDNGSHFPPKLPVDMEKLPDNPLKGRGRGIYMLNLFMDDFDYIRENNINTLTMKKKTG